MKVLFIFIHFKLQVLVQLASYYACPSLFVKPSYVYIFILRISGRRSTKGYPRSTNTRRSNRNDYAIMIYHHIVSERANARF